MADSVRSTRTRVQPVCDGAAAASSVRARLVVLRVRTVVVFRVFGEIDAFNADWLASLMISLSRPSVPTAVDLGAVEFCSVAGVRMLTNVQAQFCCGGTHLAVVPGPWITRILQLVPTDVTLPLCATLDDAIRSLVSPLESWSPRKAS